jgi:membrane peptidoglycan carboxypeptidase
VKLIKSLFKLIAVMSVFVLLVVATPVAAISWVSRELSRAWQEMPSELKVMQSPQRTHVYAVDGKTLIAIFYDENRHDVKFEDINVNMRNAMVASEDEDFFVHRGYSVRGIIRAFVSNSQGGDTQGASTITQQYVRQALTYYATTPAEIIKATEDTPARKLREIKYATALEKEYTKEQILELYMNIAYFGNRSYGIYAASQTYFNTTPDKLTPAQASLLAGLVKAPSDYDPAVKSNRKAALDRREYVLSQMVENGFLTQAQVIEAKRTPLNFVGKQTPNGCISTFQVKQLGAGFFCDYLRRWWLDNKLFGKHEYERSMKLYQGGYKVISTLDVKIQKSANKNVRNQPKQVTGRERITDKSKLAFTMSVIEPGTGRVLALATNRTFSNKKESGKTTNPLMSGSEQVHGFQAGSTFKLFTLLAALEKGYSPDYTIDTQDVYESKYVVSSGTCAPRYCTKNSNPEWMSGPRDMYTGFGRSVNTYFVPLQERVGATSAVNMARKLGVKFSARGGKSHPSDYEFSRDPQLSRSWGPFTLGVSAVTSMELAGAYATPMAKGKYCEPVPVVSLIDRHGNKTDVKSQCKQAIKESTAIKAMKIMECPMGGSGSGNCDGGTAEYVRGFVGRTVYGKTGTTDGSKGTSVVECTAKICVAGIMADPDRPLKPRVRPGHYALNYGSAQVIIDSRRW